ncbi:RdgB/HAM1 family non-canonical purine NTP pyrophosphatase [Nocardioides sp. R-C-SC26]|uniref:RdgB/HAM1 family non-canonical purine NTP pyrophosphatase n=1 Tax=Nocardioides sp. R-C-SC26 TaxID=2870414 RepID=UPI001E3BB69F|nr:RdgB/HAM1 family non-canonical purine NTP pyrophosphatase [Nocardioides sp. R-C-SC26]
MADLRLHLASRNAKKLAELERILADHLPGIEIVGLDDVPAYAEPVEDAPTFEGNARLKAQAGVAATGLATIADDSGLCVAALNGMPGVLSARWSGQPKSDERNNRLLLDQLDDVPDERRDAYFVCAIVCLTPDGQELLVEGRMDGRVIREVRGDGGFGYDVLFEADDLPGRTTAELTREEKDAIPHRGRALRAPAPQLAVALR